MQILHLDSSILGEASVSRQLSAAIVTELLGADAAAKVIARDIVSNPMAHLDGAIAAGFRQPGSTAADAVTRMEHARSEELVREFLESDVIVLGAPMYNFSVATQLKAWLDRIAQPGRTFKYTETGPIGLAGDKLVIVASTRGGMYSSGPAATMDFHEAYLTAFFGFLGIRRVKFVRAELLTKGAELRSQSISAALGSIQETVAASISV
jgi:FMN-dependent NADH-azoreductase